MSYAVTAMQIELTKEPKRYLAIANLKQPNDLTSHAKELWDVVRSIAVLDWALLQPQQTEDIEHLRTQAEEKWRTICHKAHEIAETILEEQNGHNGYKH